MIAVYIDPAIEKYSRQVKFTIEYILEINGYFWKYLDADTELSKTDLILYYSPTLPANEHLDWLTSRYSVIYIPFVKEFYIPGFYSGDNLKNNIKFFKLEINIPLISAKRFTKSPLNVVERNENLFSFFEFDLIGNVFYQITDDDKAHLNEKDKDGNLIYEKLGFYEHFKIPYVSYYIEILNKLIKELVTEKKCDNNSNSWMLRRALWPSDQPLAAIISHNLDKLQKWNIGSLLFSFIEHTYLFFTLRWKYLFRSFISKYKYFFTNQEDYWNFYDISFFERKYKFRSTWFIGVNQKNEHIFDYNIDDKEVLKELEELYSHGAEIALLTPEKKLSTESIRKDIELLMSTLKLSKKGTPYGVRHQNLSEDSENLHKCHRDLNFKYDSSKRLPDLNAFINGFSLPYPIFNKTVQKDDSNIWEFPVSFSDEVLKLTKYKDVPFDTAMNSIKEMIKTVKKNNGLLHFQFSNSLFHDIPYMHKLFEYTLDQLKHQGAYVTTCSNVYDWLNKREAINITEKDDSIIIKFNEDIEQISFEVVGKKIISRVDGGNCNYKKNAVQFINVKKDLEVEIHIIDNQSVFETNE